MSEQEPRETTHGLIDGAAFLLDAHGFTETAQAMLDAKAEIPNVPAVNRIHEEKARNAALPRASSAGLHREQGQQKNRLDGGERPAPAVSVDSGANVLAREPTEEMIEAVLRRARDGHAPAILDGNAYANVRDMLRAALDAAREAVRLALEEAAKLCEGSAKGADALAEAARDEAVAEAYRACAAAHRNDAAGIRGEAAGGMRAAHLAAAGKAPTRSSNLAERLEVAAADMLYYKGGKCGKPNPVFFENISTLLSEAADAVGKAPTAPEVDGAALLRGFTESILHGDDKHRAWLRAECEKYLLSLAPAAKEKP